MAELEHDNLREITVHIWCIIYHPNKNQAFMIPTVHKRQIPGRVTCPKNHTVLSDTQATRD